MRILSFLEKGSRNTSKVQKSVAPVAVLDSFETYVKQCIFPSENFTLLEQSHRSDNSERLTLDPDFKFLDKRTNKQFWVEAKFRSEEYGGRIFWCTEDQLRRYLNFHKKTPTFVVLGIGGEPATPDAIYLLSMTQARYVSLFESAVKNFKIPFNAAVSSQILWNR